MPALLKSTEGRRQCDAKCYNATGEYCECICEGVNHGVGLANARLNIATREEFTTENPNIKIRDAARQLPLSFPFFR